MREKALPSLTCFLAKWLLHILHNWNTPILNISFFEGSEISAFTCLMWFAIETYNVWMLDILIIIIVIL